ncbi:MAG: hypothetical protein QF682_08660 [Candidatus Thermoplasmatota archaeon]|jgi:hypothetical protein|nr:hypothetical protein [Candidatus Thermoplasmatota archaeon]
MDLTGQFGLLLSSGIAIIPTALFIYFSLKLVYHKLEDKKLYFMLGLALFTGVLVGVFQTFMGAYVRESGELFIILAIAVLFSLFDNLFKIILLNLERYRTKPETTFYGVCFSLTGTMVVALHGFREVAQEMNSPNILVLIVGYFIFLFAAIAYHAAMGIYNGYYSSLGKFWTFSHISRVTLISLPFNGLIFFWYYSSHLDLISVSIGLTYSLVILYVIMKKYFPMSLPKDEQKKLTSSFPWKKDHRNRKSLGQRFKEISERD